MLFAILLVFSSAVGAQTRPTIGLALSGGGARGIAHVGVLQVLEREQYEDLAADNAELVKQAASLARHMQRPLFTAESFRRFLWERES